MQLRSRGFRVETVAPDQIPTSPADLEVRLEECMPEDVLTKAAVVKESEDLWVFVAPGALDERSRPMRVIPLVPQVVEMRSPECIAAQVAAIKPTLEVSVVEVKGSVLEPEDDPILSELAARETLIADSDPVVQKVQALPAPVEVTTPVVTEKPAAVPVPIKAKPASVPPTRSLERIKRIVVTRPVIPQIPIVPERVEPKLILQPAVVAATAKPRVLRKSYKVAFQSGPKFWRTASVTLALLVLAGLLATVVAVRPPLPAAKTGTGNGHPATFLPAAQASSTANSTGHATAPVPNSTHVPKAIQRKTAASSADSQNQRDAAPRRRTASDDGIIAEDTVTFYDRKPAPRAAKLPPASDPKRYSDAN